MRVIIEKLAALYPDIDRSRVILKFAGINTLSISFAAAALVNWINIFEALDTNPQNMIDLFKEVLQDGDNISTNDKALFEKQIEELEAKLKESASELVIDGKIAPQAFDIHSVYSKRFAFINRDNVKRNFQKMLNDDGSPHVLMIEGKPGSGLTHSQLYIADVINATGNFKLAQILIEDNGNKNHYATGGELAEEISQIFNLTYTPEDEDKMALSKHTTFFTQLKELNEGEEAIGKIPIICLDGLYRIANPNLNSFISDLLHEAITYKKFYVILTLLDDNLMRRDWPDRLKEWKSRFRTYA